MLIPLLVRSFGKAFEKISNRPVIGCETWSLILQEERKLRVFENMVLRRIFGPRKDEVTGGKEEIA